MSLLAGRIKALRKSASLTQTEFAEAIGVSQGTVSRWEKGVDPDFEHLQKLADFADEPVDLFASPEARFPEGFQRIAVVGEVQAGEWREALEWDESRHELLFMHEDERFKGIPRFALKVAGPSMNQIYPEGSLVVCVRFMELDRDPQDGEKVIVYQRDKQGLFEATIKQYVEDESGQIYLWPRSNHPDYQAPVKFTRPDETEDGDDVKIHALVVASIRKE